MRRTGALAVLVTLAVVTVLVLRSQPPTAPTNEPVLSGGGDANSDAPDGDDLASIRRFVIALTERAERQVPLSVADAVVLERAMASEAGADELGAKVERDLEALSEAGNRAAMTYWVAPLAMRVAERLAERATVEVWQVGALEIAGVRVTQHWATVTYELVWERDAWRLDAERSSDGPQPQTLAGTSPESPSSFGVRIAGFETVDATTAGAAR